MSRQGAARLVNIPEEMLVLIFDKLDSVTRTRCERVCQQWKRILRETPSLTQTIKIDFCYVLADPRSRFNQVGGGARRCLLQLGRKRKDLHTVILTDESYPIASWNHKANNQKERRSVDHDTLKSVAELAGKNYMTGKKEQPLKLVLHRIAVDYWGCLELDSRCYPSPHDRDDDEVLVRQITSKNFKEVILDNVMVLRVVVREAVSVDWRYNHLEKETRFYVPFGKIVVANASEDVWQLLCQFWTDIGAEKRGRLVEYFVGKKLVPYESQMNRLVKSLIRSEARFKSMDSTLVKKVLERADKQFVESLLAATQADLLALMEEFEFDKYDTSPADDDYNYGQYD